MIENLCKEGGGLDCSSVKVDIGRSVAALRQAGRQVGRQAWQDGCAGHVGGGGGGGGGGQVKLHIKAKPILA